MAMHTPNSFTVSLLRSPKIQFLSSTHEEIYIHMYVCSVFVLDPTNSTRIKCDLCSVLWVVLCSVVI